jgi:hypothetical protein
MLQILQTGAGLRISRIEAKRFREVTVGLIELSGF